MDTIAGALGAPRNYLSKTLNVLAKHEIVDGVRGVHGGFALAHWNGSAEVEEQIARIRTAERRDVA